MCGCEGGPSPLPESAEQAHLGNYELKQLFFHKDSKFQVAENVINAHKVDLRGVPLPSKLLPMFAPGLKSIKDLQNLLFSDEVHADELFKTGKKLPERIRNYLLSIAQMITRFDLPTGCLICNSTSEIAGDCLPYNATTNISAMNQQTVISLTTFFEKEQNEGNLNKKCLAKTLANYLLTLQFGLAISARNGSDMEELIEVIDFSIGKF